jgi:predicted ATPase
VRLVVAALRAAGNEARNPLLSDGTLRVLAIAAALLSAN